MSFGVLLDILNRKYFAQVYECDYEKTKVSDVIPAVLAGPIGFLETLTLVLMYLQFKFSELNGKNYKRNRKKN